MQSAIGQRAEALRSVGEAVQIRRKLAEANAKSFLPGLAMSLNNQANRQSEMGQKVEALRSIGEAVAIYRKLAHVNSEMFLHALASSLTNQAALQSEMGQSTEALRSILEEVTIYGKLAETNPDVFLPHLARSLGAWGQALSETDAKAAAEKFAEAIKTIAPFVKQLLQAHLPLALALSRSYTQSCESAKIEPSPEIMGHIAEFRLRAGTSGN